ncbi:MAG: tRNA (adenosine(37)-N6)-threonylcarbamoyltransferase complex dimerization subunit type 1 TsaB [Citromicrobium sp.]|nr:MAG: tRNA (adenosine(37)-N6)-threonylcarbamoyltransferase complex dimerization subunit type 1 TsaB [Citromicrobium sp.]
MRTLVIETATEACSVALFEGSALIDARHELLGRGHAERLVPVIAAMADNGRSDEIHVSLGPGSFTGIRIGIAAARALGIAWSARVRGYPTLGLVATMARRGGAGDVTVCMSGGHGEWFVQDFDAVGLPRSPASSMSPEALAERGASPHVAGSKAERFVQSQPAGRYLALNLLPDARSASGMPTALISDDLTPLYGRPPDAKVPAQ